MANIENMKEMQIVEDSGDTVLAPGESTIIGMHNRSGSVQVSVASTASYMVSVSQARKTKVEGDTAVFLPAEEEDKATNGDFYIKYGGFVKIENRDTSAGNITVDWRV